MPKTTSKNWDRWSDEERDRRHRNAEESNQSKHKSLVISNKRRCPKCHKKLNGPLSIHLELFHRRTVSSQPQSRTRKSSTKAEVKILRDGEIIGKRKETTTISLAKELGQYLPRYVLDLAQREGVKILTTSTRLPPSLVNKIRIEFRALLQKSNRR
jgi:hypothetical protein